jgi:two-component system, OmpR family, copper resistance phosphate regulon response regulator CusR
MLLGIMFAKEAAEKMKILIVEDETKTGQYLQQGLTESGFSAVHITNGLDAVHEIAEGNYALIILDVMLPGLNGWEVLREIRRLGYSMPVLYLSAKDQVEDRVKGLELGADDYLVKPFSFAELLARVRTQLRRGSQETKEMTLRVADLELDLLKRRATRGNKQRLELTAKEFLLLEFMMQRKSEVLPRTLIASQVWDINFDSDTNVIDVAIRRLRTKVDDSFGVKLIHTVRGMGYVLEVRESDSL